MKWLKDKWAKFEAWVHTWLPGVKTKITLGLGMLGSGAAALQEYLAKVPAVGKYLTAERIAIASFVLFTLAYWFRGMGERVVETKIEKSLERKAPKERK